MILKWGNYTHDSNEVTFTVAMQELVSETGFVYGFTQTWDISGWMHGDSQADLTSNLAQLEAAYAVGGKDLVFYLDNGTTATQHRLLNNQTMGGTRSSGISYPDGSGAEYSTFRRYRVQVSGDLFLASAAASNLILSWQEEIETLGTGGPTVVYLPVLQGLWQQQQTTDSSLATIVQSGSAVGLTGFISPPAPVFPSLVIGTETRLVKRSPRIRAGAYWEYPSSWSYTMQSNTFPGIPSPNMPNF